MKNMLLSNVALLGMAAVLINNAKDEMTYQILESPEKEVTLTPQEEVEYCNLIEPGTVQVYIQDLYPSVGEATAEGILL